MNYSASPERQRLFLCFTPLSFGAKYEIFDKIIRSCQIQRPFSTHPRWDALEECSPWPHTSLIPFSLREVFEIKRLQTLRERTYIRYGNDVSQSTVSQKRSSATGPTNKLRKRFQANEFFFFLRYHPCCWVIEHLVQICHNYWKKICGNLLKDLFSALLGFLKW